MQATDLTPRGLELEVDIGNPSPLEERGDHKLGLHSNCWGEVRRIAAHVVALLEFTCPCQPIKGEEISLPSIKRHLTERPYVGNRCIFAASMLRFFRGV